MVDKYPPVWYFIYIIMYRCISSDKSGPSFSSVDEKTNTEIKKEFGAALAKVLAESTPVRELIKRRL